MLVDDGGAALARFHHDQQHIYYLQRDTDHAAISNNNCKQVGFESSFFCNVYYVRKMKKKIFWLEIFHTIEQIMEMRNVNRSLCICLFDFVTRIFLFTWFFDKIMIYEEKKPSPDSCFFLWPASSSTTTSNKLLKIRLFKTQKLKFYLEFLKEVLNFNFLISHEIKTSHTWNEF